VIKLFFVIFTQPLTGDEDEEHGVTVSTFFLGYDGDLCRGLIAGYPASESNSVQVAVPIYQRTNRLSKLPLTSLSEARPLLTHIPRKAKEGA
jgi:hypothetical protein